MADLESQQVEMSEDSRCALATRMHVGGGTP